jgi:hypothetical protein
MDKRLILTDKQREAWNNLLSAFKKCEDVKLAVILTQDGMIYALNETDVEGYQYREDFTDDSVSVDRDELPSLEISSLDLNYEDDIFGVTFK